MPINFPANIFPANESWTNESNTQSFSSPLTKSEQTTALAGSRWRCSLSFVNLSRAEGRALNAFIMELRGRSGEAFVIPYDARAALGSPSGTPFVSGSGQTGNTLLTTGWPVSTTVLKAGDYFEVNGELKVITADAITDVAGVATLTFAPDLHKPPPASDPIVYTNPACTMRLSNDTQASWQLTQDKLFIVNLEFLEVLV